jgi:hypothetical protein
LREETEQRRKKKTDRGEGKLGRLDMILADKHRGFHV